MEILKQAIEAIGAAEERLRELISHAAATADYDQLPQLAEWAKQLASMIAGPRAVPMVMAISTGERDAGAIERLPGLESEVSLAVPFRPQREQTRQPLASRARAGPRKKGRGAARGGGYPKFLREGETLVKIGWSKKEKAPYEHKAPRRVLTALTRAIEKAGRGGKRFGFEDLLPLPDPDGVGEVPSYQAYLALAWMRAENLLTQHGRQGYSIHDGTDLTALIAERWQSLAAR